MSAKIGQPRVHSSANQTHGTMKHQTKETWQALGQSIAHAIDPGTLTSQEACHGPQDVGIRDTALGLALKQLCKSLKAYFS